MYASNHSCQRCHIGYYCNFKSKKKENGVPIHEPNQDFTVSGFELSFAFSHKNWNVLSVSVAMSILEKKF